MDIEERTRNEVQRHLGQLRNKYGEFPLDQERVTNEPDFFKKGVRLAEEGWIGDAGAWVTDDEGRVLLIRHSNSPDEWGTPGGGHEPGESLEETARREIREETGVECSLTGVYWARQKTIVHENDSNKQISMLTIEFEADYTGGELDIGDSEILEAKWFAEPPKRVHNMLDDKIEQWKQSMQL
ncbi:NUDIX hydrolase [Haloferax larsenii]|uniref:ADP-ribose pyrophosphatase YjhB, NUDIX family n=1 Tax=Haloferax larsenii TaxID=302484 RepID=A0A1H7LIB9_HALLR|nr:NUDIX domain-containing protein [Haloferax larsenii]SEK98633.1 ADP-ribose pyrophosphatase YjhB, NUDIX family [Haloferax larsenii]